MIENGFSVYSQFGEDGVLQYLIRTLNLSNKQCCEFGMSGITFSNTFNLVENYDWLGVFIEKNENELKTGLKLKSYETHLFIHYYQVGDYFGKHRDSIEIGANNRAYVVGFNINDDYEGGDYILYNPDEMINKTAGIPYYFKSDREHEITKVKGGIRKSAVLFINYENLYIEKNLL